MKITKFKFYLNQLPFFNFFLTFIRFHINKNKFTKSLNNITKNLPLNNDVILAPLIESSHYVNILLLILLKYLEKRGNKVIILLCDESLIACEIKNCFTENNKFVCSKCKFNRKNFLKIFQFDTILLSNFNNLKPIDILPTFKDFKIDKNFEYQNKKIHQPVLDSVYRFFYGNYDEKNSKFIEIYYKNLFVYIWMTRISIELDNKYKIKKVLSFMTAYSSWHPIFNYFQSKGNRFSSFSLTQFDIRGITIDYHDLYPAKERYYIFKNKRNAKYLLDHELVADVFHPALPHTKNHKIWKRDFSGSTGLFSFMLKKKFSNTQIEKFFNKLKIFKLGYSWGGFDSLITFPPLDKREFKNKNTGTLIRLYCGLEDIDDQIKDIKSALKVLN